MISRVQQAKAIIHSVVDERNEKQLDSVNRCLIQAFDLLAAAEVELREQPGVWGNPRRLGSDGKWRPAPREPRAT